MRVVDEGGARWSDRPNLTGREVLPIGMRPTLYFDNNKKERPTRTAPAPAAAARAIDPPAKGRTRQIE